MKRIILGVCASFATLILLAAAPDPQQPVLIPLCPGCSALAAGLPPQCPANVNVTVNRKIFLPGMCGCVGGECLQARTCLAVYMMTVTDAAGAHVFTASTNQCGGYQEDHPTGQGCGPGFIFATCTPCAESCF